MTALVHWGVSGHAIPGLLGGPRQRFRDRRAQPRPAHWGFCTKKKSIESDLTRQHRPDCSDLIVVADAGARDAAETGRQKMIDSLTNAWRGDGVTSNIGASLQRGPIADAAEAERVRGEACAACLTRLTNAWRT